MSVRGEDRAQHRAGGARSVADRIAPGAPTLDSCARKRIRGGQGFAREFLLNMMRFSRLRQAAALGLLGLCAGLCPVALAAQDNSTIGNPQLRDFQLPGQRTTPPAQPQPVTTAPPAATRPAPATTAPAPTTAAPPAANVRT